MLSAWPARCLSCVVCFQSQCLYAGLPIVHFWVELCALAFCIHQLSVLSGSELPTRGRLRRQLYVILVVNSVSKLLRDSLSVFGWDWGPLGVYAVSLIPTTGVSVDLVMVCYWAQAFHHRHAATIGHAATAANVVVHSTNAALCALRIAKKVPHEVLLLFWGVSLGLMSLLYLNFIPMVASHLKAVQAVLSPDRCRPLRRSFYLSVLVVSCYIVRSVVYCLAAFHLPPVLWLVGSAPRNTLYTVVFVFCPSWVTMVTFSSHLLRPDPPPSQPATKSPQVSDCEA